MHAIDLNAVRILPPVPKPPKILCVGLNYDDHLEESGLKKPVYPEIFARFATSLVAHGEPIRLPPESFTLDYEAELAVVIGRRGRRINRDRALDHVAGYSLFNDATIRDFQLRTPQWTMGKNFDATGAFGPWLVTPDALPPGAHGLRIQGRLNGRVMQDASTDLLIFSVPDADRNDQRRDQSGAGRCDHHRNARWRWGRAQAACFHAAGRCLRSGDRGDGCLEQPRPARVTRGGDALIRKLFSATPQRIGRCEGLPKSDAVPASLVDGTPSGLKADLIALLGKQNVLHRAIDLVRFASDASPYRLIPQVVVQPRTTEDIVKLFRYCRAERKARDAPVCGNQPERSISIGRYTHRRAPSLVRRQGGWTMAAGCARVQE